MDRDAKATAPSNRSSSTLFLEDTVSIQLHGGEPIVGVIVKTWHDLDEQDIWSEVEASIPGDKATQSDLTKFVRTGQPPRQFYLFAPSSPENVPVLVHEAECTLLDRALGFGDVVKRSLNDPQSGTVVAIDTNVSVRKFYVDPFKPSPQPFPESALIENVPEAELKLVNDWNTGDFVIYKNSWMGVLDGILEAVTIKLSNGSVVVIYDPLDLEVPVSTEDFIGNPSEYSQSTSTPAAGASRKQKPRTVAPPEALAPGHLVLASNLWKGRWIYGAYDPAISPLGVIVDVKTEYFDVKWLCQNVMVSGRFVPVEMPPTRMILEEDGDYLVRFKKSTGGFSDISGNPLKEITELNTGGELEVGDRVRFDDLDAAVTKYSSVKRIPRSEVMGFEVNTFIVVATTTRVRVLWQDMTESVDYANKLVPYLNVDEHEVWPGEFVVVKPDLEASATSAPNPQSAPGSRDQIGGLWDMLNTVSGGLPTAEAGVEPEFMKPEKVGVVQSVNPADRLASVRWFESPNVEVAAGIIVPGSKTGPLEHMSEDVSLYDAVAHSALGVRRGDFVLITPEQIAEEEVAVPAPVQTVTSSTDADMLSPGAHAHLNHFVEGVRGLVDNGLISNLAAALGNHSHPQLQALSRILNQYPGIMNAIPPRPDATPQNLASAVAALARLPPDWLGEVVDLGLDGLITVRLGALDKPRDIRVPIERLHIVFNEDMDLGDEDDDLDDEDSSSEDELDYDGMDEPEAIEEKIIYEGGERLDHGGEEDWLTDDNDEFEDDDSDDEITDLIDVSVTPKETPAEKEPGGTTATALEPVPRTPPPIPDNVPAPEAIRLTPGAPSRFLVLDTPIPSDHAYKNQPATARTTNVARRIAREHKILSTSLPEGIFVRTWESRLDLLRVLIVGPLNTPYELAPFVFDFHFTNNFPTHPPVGYFHSWTSGIGRVNPNLYEDGKICLSLLGTWHAEKRGEGWSAAGSSVLQLLVSLMGLVLVREPWYNEAGFGIYEGAEEAALNSQLYSEKAYILARGFVKHVMQRPVEGFESVIDWLYLPPGAAKDNHEDGEGEELGPGPSLLKEVVDKAREVIKRSEDGAPVSVEETTDGVGRVSRGALALLKRHLGVLEKILADKTSEAAVVTV